MPQPTLQGHLAFGMRNAKGIDRKLWETKILYYLTLGSKIE
jgi:hypothetical protein